jgi:hypothetical protein
VISGQTVAFRTTLCQFQGTISGTPPNRITGTGTCNYQLAGQPVTSQSTWEITR